MSLKTIEANVPIIGNTLIHFYKDSFTYWEFIDNNELTRLNNIKHLGPASIAHTGANHTRLEYTFLQCAIIELAAKIHKDSSSLEISNGIKLAGLGKTSSGEDILKTWSLISSYGHLNWTYASERVLLQLCYENKEIRSWLLKGIRDSDLRKWCNKVINNYDDHLFHYVISIKRIYSGTPYDRNKTKLVKYLRNLLISTEDLFPDDLNCRFKLHRLRKLFQRIRILSIASIDSYNSGSSIRFHLSSSLTDINHFIYSKWDEKNLNSELESLVGDLASKLYYHPQSTPIQRSYVAEKKPSLKARIEKVISDEEKSSQLLKAILNDGVGKPDKNRLSHLIRLTFKGAPVSGYFGFKNKFELQKHIEKVVGNNKSIFISVEKNYFKKELFIDVHYVQDTSLDEISISILKLKNWVLRSLKADFKRRTRFLNRYTGKELERYKKRVFKSLMRKYSGLFDQLFFSIIKLLLPDNWGLDIKDYIPTNDSDSPIYYKIELENDLSYNNITDRLERHINDNPYRLDLDRIQELKAIDRLIKYTQSEITLSCSEKIIITDNHGISIDEWDGVIIKLDNDHLRVIIVETKNFKSGSKKNENKSWEQLDDTIPIVTKKFDPKYQRKRIKNLGARLILSLLD